MRWYQTMNEMRLKVIEYMKYQSYINTLVSLLVMVCW